MFGPPRRLGVDVSVMVARIIQPGSFPGAAPLASVPSMRKSFLTYWFSLKTLLREGRSATQPVVTLATPVAKSAPNRMVESLNVFMITRCS